MVPKGAATGREVDEQLRHTLRRRERQLEGIAKAKAEGVYAKNAGRKATLNADKVRELHAAGIGPAAIAKQLKMARSSVYRLLEQDKSAA